MAVEIANAVVNLTPSLRGLGREIDRQVRGVDTRRAGQQAGESYTTGFGGAAKKLTGVLAAGFAAVKIGDFAKDAIGQASDLNEAATKIAVVFGDGAKAVTDFSAQGAKALGQTSLQAENAAATFGVFGKAAGLTGKENAKFSTGLTQLATDMASFSNTTPDDAIEALGAGLRGESEPLRRYGVLLDDASLRQEALAQGLITTTKDALTPQQKVLAAHALILKQTKDAQGDFARTSGGLANQQRILSAQWTDAKGKLGQAFLPGVTAVVSALNDKLFPIIDKIIKVVPGMVEKISAAWSVLKTGDFKGKLGKLGVVEDSPLVAALLFAHKTFEQVQKPLSGAWSILFHGDFTGFKSSGFQEDSPLAAALFHARDAFEKIGPGLKEAWSVLSSGDFQGGLGFQEDSPFVNFLFMLRDAGLDVLGKLRDIWDQLWSLGEKLWPSIASLGKSFFDAWQTINNSGWSVFALVFDGIKLAIDGVIAVLNNTLVPALDWLARFFRENPAEVYILVGAFAAWKTVTLAIAAGQWAVQAATKAWAAAQWLLDAALNANPISLVIIAIAALAAGIVWAYQNVGWFRDAVDAAWSFIKDATTAVWEGVLKPAFTWIADNVHYVGDAFTWLWSNAIQPAWEGISAAVSFAWNSVILPIFGLLEGSVTTVGNIFSWLWNSIIVPVWNGISEAISRAWNLIIKPIWDLLVGAIHLVADTFSWLWNNIVVPVWNGITGAISSAWNGVIVPVFDALKRGISDVGAFFSGLWTKVSDVWSWIQDKLSKVWNWVRDNVFAPLNQGVQGIMDFFGRLWNTVVDVWDKIQTKISAVWNWINEHVFAPLNLGINTIITFFESLWAKVQEIWNNVSGFFSGIATSIADAVRNVKKSIDDIITAVKNFFVKVAGGSESGGVFNNLQGALGAPGSSRGSVVPGSDPGRLDNHIMQVRSQESIMVPEFTRRVGGSVGVAALNRAAESGNLQIGGLARGGVVGLAATGEDLGKSIGDSMHNAVLKLINDKIQPLVGGGVNAAGFNPSQDPSSFGWVRAANQQPFSWNGLGTEVAGGTQGLWTRLLTTLNSVIAGGVTTIGGFENRNNVNNPGVPSFHSYGLAMDVNAPQNPNGVSAASIQGQYGAIPIGPARSIASQLGMLWGGDFTGTPDPMHFEIHVPPSAIGGASVKLPDNTNTNTPGGLLGNILSSIKNAVGFGGGDIGGPASVGSGVERWRGRALQALTAAGESPGFVNDLLMQMQHESSGDPNSVNGTDINAQNGTPSVGLMQVIFPTFRDALTSHGFGNLVSRGLKDPYANILSSVLYTKDRYGDLGYWRRNGFGPYDNGGMFPGGSIGVNLLNKPEAVLTPKETSAYQTHADALARGFGGYVVRVELNGGDEISKIMARTAKTTVINELDAEGFRLDTVGAQS